MIHRTQYSLTGSFGSVVVVLQVVVKVKESVHGRSRQQDEQHSNIHGTAALTCRFVS